MASSTTIAAEPLDLLRLRDVICKWESQAEPDPDDAVGHHDGSIGRCQIKPGTARLAGYRGKNAALLGPGSAELNRSVALSILALCWLKHPTWGVRGMAYCYNAGPYKPLLQKGRHWAYAQARAVEYAISSKPR